MNAYRKSNENRIYRGERISFQRAGKRIGRGGNGEVYPIAITEGYTQLTEDQQKCKYVVKLFSVWGKSQVERERRYIRFCQEVKKQSELSEYIPGIMPIVDWCLPEKCPTNKEAWYIMPVAESIEKVYGMNLIEKLDIMLHLLDIIDGIHQEGVAHRDIKPDNLFLLDGKICLADFGLLWTKTSPSISVEGIPVGPYSIIPPEMESGQRIRGFTYRESDIYLFAKVLWIIIKGRKAGFYGEYYRSNAQMNLSCENYNCTTFEPLHMLLEGATCHKWEERITIKRCRELLIDQLYICKGILPIEKEQAYIQKEASKFFKLRTEPDETVYKDSQKIYEYLDTVLKNQKLQMQIGPEIYDIKYGEILKKDKDFLLVEEITPIRTKCILVSVDQLSITKERCEIQLNAVDNIPEGYIGISQITSLEYLLHTKVAIDVDIKIKSI